MFPGHAVTQSLLLGFIQFTTKCKIYFWQSKKPFQDQKEKGSIQRKYKNDTNVLFCQSGKMILSGLDTRKQTGVSYGVQKNVQTTETRDLLLVRLYFGCKASNHTLVHISHFRQLTISLKMAKKESVTCSYSGGSSASSIILNITFAFMKFLETDQPEPISAFKSHFLQNYFWTSWLRVRASRFRCYFSLTVILKDNVARWLVS